MIIRFSNGLSVESQSGDDLRRDIAEMERVLAKMKNELDNRAGDGNEKMYGFNHEGIIKMWPTFAEAADFVTQYMGNPDYAYIVKPVYRLK